MKVKDKIEVLKQLMHEMHPSTTLHDCWKSILQETPYTCPKCEGKGFTLETYNAYPTNLPDSGWVDDIRTRSIECTVCKGEGYTEKEIVPIIETKIKGYKEK